MTPPTPPSAEEIAALEALMEKATPGPWLDLDPETPFIHDIHSAHPSGSAWVATDMTEEDAVLILAMHRALPSLLSAARERERIADKLREVNVILTDHANCETDCSLHSDLVEFLAGGAT